MCQVLQFDNTVSCCTCQVETVLYRCSAEITVRERGSNASVNMNPTLNNPLNSIQNGFCISVKGGIGGGGWVTLQKVHVGAARLGC